MSYFEDFEEDKIGSLEYDDYYSVNTKPQYTYQTLTTKWKTRDGQILELKDMKKDHIINCLNMILNSCRKNKWNPNNYQIYRELRKEFDKRVGD